MEMATATRLNTSTGPDKPVLAAGDVTLETEAEGTAEEGEDDGVPYDRGWAWMVFFGMFVNFVVMSGYLKSSGIIFVQLLHKFKATATHTALLFSVRAAIYSVSGLYVMNVCLPRFGCRTLVMTGGLCMALSAILSSLANELTLVIMIYSVFFSLAMSLAVSPGEVLVGHYFKRHRSLALSLGKCGSSVGNVTMPPLITCLLQQYGLAGALLLCGAVCLHSIPAAMLYRPTSFWKRDGRSRPLRRREAGIGSSGQALDGTESVLQKQAPTQGAVKITGVREGSVEVVSESSAVVHCESIREGVERSLAVRTSGGAGASGDVPHRTRRSKSDVRYDAPLFSRPGTRTGSRATNFISDSRLWRACHPKSNFDGMPSRTGKQLHAPTLELLDKRSDSALFKHLDIVCSKTMDKSSCKWVNTREAGLATMASSSLGVGNEKAASGCSAGKHPLSGGQLTSVRARPCAAAEGVCGKLGVLDAISQSSVVRFFSMTSVDGVSAPLASSIPALQDKAGSEGEAGTCWSLYTGLQQERKEFVPGWGSTSTCCRCKGLASLAVFLPGYSLFLCPVFRLLMLYISVAGIVNTMLDYLPALLTDNHITETQTAQLLSVIGSLDLLFRLVCAFLLHRQLLTAQTLIIVSFLVLALAAQFVRFMATFQHFVALAVLQGLFGGVSNCLFPVLVINFVGLHHMGQAIGFCILVSGACLAVFYPLMGYIRDTTGSYVVVYHVMGLGLLLAAVALCCEGTVRRRATRQQSAREKSSSTHQV